MPKAEYWKRLNCAYLEIIEIRLFLFFGLEFEVFYMSRFIYCHIGQKPPEYLLDSIQSIKKVDLNAHISLISDQDINIDGVDILQVDQIISNQTKRVMEMKLFKKESNPLWRTSIFRIFLIRDAIKYLGLSFCYHFDSDVLLFMPSIEFESTISDFDGLYITPCNSNEYVFGFSRFGSLSKTEALCNILHKIIFNRFIRRFYYFNMPNEMQFLAGIARRRPDLIKTLDVMPSIEVSFLFDPSSYGQYFGGTHADHTPGFAHKTHYIGEEIINGNIHPLMIENKPYVKKNEVNYPIVNLHIHSKKTNVFL